MFRPIRYPSFILLALCALPALAQTPPPPNVGQILQQERTAPKPPVHPPALSIQPPAATPLLPGGATVKIETIHFTGNSVFSNQQLIAALGKVTGQSFDLAGLQALAQKVTTFYRDKGYPFAKAYLPAQKLTNGVLGITVLEGHYGQVKAKGKAELAVAAQKFLSRLKPGAVIKNASLERTTLILNDLPGIITSPLIRPGQEVGAGDLVVAVSRKPLFTGKLGIDNHGNRYTGEYRAYANLQWDSPFTFGDQLTLRNFVSDTGQWLGDLGYSLPLGTSGLRGQLDYAHTYYKLGEQFSSLEASGIVDIASAGLSYPLIRSQRRNLTLSVTWQKKKFDDEQNAVNIDSRKHSNVLPLMLQFNQRDGFFGGGTTYGNLIFTNGDLNLDAALKAVDAVTARTAGSFQKLNIDVVRLQAASIPKLSLYGRISAQWASKNLDSSEEFGLGGPYGVRAYPVGEGFGDEGGFVQMEARYRINRIAPYVFYDVGQVKININPWTAGTNYRTLAGAGVGLRYYYKAFNVDGLLAWRTHGGAPTSDTSDRNPRAWVTAGWQF